MKIIVKAKPLSKEEKVERLGQASLDFTGFKSELAVYKVWVKESPIQDRANKAIIIALAKYFDIAPSSICLISGKASKTKVFEVNSKQPK